MIVRGQLFHRGENGEGNLIRTPHTLGKAQPRTTGGLL